jgi:hypothetical protein
VGSRGTDRERRKRNQAEQADPEFVIAIAFPFFHPSTSPLECRSVPAIKPFVSKNFFPRIPVKFLTGSLSEVQSPD